MYTTRVCTRNTGSRYSSSSSIIINIVYFHVFRNIVLSCCIITIYCSTSTPWRIISTGIFISTPITATSNSKITITNITISPPIIINPIRTIIISTMVSSSHINSSTSYITRSCCCMSTSTPPPSRIIKCIRTKSRISYFSI